MTSRYLTGVAAFRKVAWWNWLLRTKERLHVLVILKSFDVVLDLHSLRLEKA